MDEQYIQQRVHEILEGQIAMGAGEGGAIAGALSDWVSFVKFVRDLAASDGFDISYKEAMQLASPVWKSLQARGIAPSPKGQPMRGEWNEVQKMAAREYPKVFGRPPREPEASPLDIETFIAPPEQIQILQPPAKVSDADLAEYIDEILGEGFSVGDILGVLKEIAPLARELAPLARGLMPARKPAPRRAPPKRKAPAKRRAPARRGRGEGVMAESGYQGISGAGIARRNAKGQFVAKRKAPARMRKAAGVKAGARAGVKAGAKAGGRLKPKNKGIYEYHCELRRFKEQHPRMTHLQAVQSPKFKKHWAAIKAAA